MKLFFTLLTAVLASIAANGEQLDTESVSNLLYAYNSEIFNLPEVIKTFGSKAIIMLAVPVFNSDVKTNQHERCLWRCPFCDRLHQCELRKGHPRNCFHWYGPKWYPRYHFWKPGH